MTQTILIITGLAVDLLGGLLIVIPEIVNTNRISKKPSEKILLEKKVTPREKYRYLKGGVILLMIGFFTQILGHVLP